MDYLEYIRKGFPLVCCSFLLFMFAFAWFVYALLQHRSFYLLPVVLSILPSVLAFVMSWPRVYRREVLFQRIAGIHQLLFAGYLFAAFGVAAVRAGEDLKRGQGDSTAILFITMALIFATVSPLALVRRYIPASKEQDLSQIDQSMTFDVWAYIDRASLKVCFLATATIPAICVISTSPDSNPILYPRAFALLMIVVLAWFLWGLPSGWDTRSNSSAVDIPPKGSP